MTHMDDDTPTPERHSLPRRARRAIFAVPRPLHALLLVICLMLGVALVTQVRAQQQDPLETMGEQDLVLLLDELTTRADDLRSERGDLNSQLTELQNSASQREAAEKAAADALVQSQINAGTVAVHGEGVVMTVRDPLAKLPATQFIMALGELRNSGAEAISLNGVRLTAQTWFSSDDGSVVVDGTTISSPYTWQVIGDSATIAPALEIAAGSASQMRLLGAQVTVEPSQDVVIDVVVTPSSPRFATVE
jgi:Uncharacterized protein conserved in bacteria